MARRTRREFLRAVGMGALAVGWPGTRAGAASPPNILLIFPDQHRPDWVGTNPALPLPTPHLNALGKRGARFERALSPAPVCAPARACLASGREYDRCRVASNQVDYPLDQTTVYTRLQEADYHVMGCGKFDLHKDSHTWGVKGDHLLPEWGFSDGIDNAGKWDAIISGTESPRDPYMAYLQGAKLKDVHVQDFQNRKKQRHATFPTPLPEKAYCDNWIGQNGLDLLRRVPEGKPWFMQVNFTGPHEPMDITARMEGPCRKLTYPQPNRATKLTEAKHAAVRQNYGAMITNIDRWLGLYEEELRKRGEFANTLIVFSSDHGEMLGDRDMWGKTKAYQASAGVPLVMAGPGIRGGLTTRTPVSLVDLTATFLDYGRTEPLDGMEGRSLRPVLAGRAESVRDYAFSGLYRWRVVYDGRYKLIARFGVQDHKKHRDGVIDLGGPIRFELYDLDTDPFENKDVATDAPETLARLQDALMAQLRQES
jgi:arylsulfatase A-like enzyme